jgi:hypothetical protein
LARHNTLESDRRVREQKIKRYVLGTQITF